MHKLSIKSSCASSAKTGMHKFLVKTHMYNIPAIHNMHHLAAKKTHGQAPGKTLMRKLAAKHNAQDYGLTPVSTHIRKSGADYGTSKGMNPTSSCHNPNGTGKPPNFLFRGKIELLESGVWKTKYLLEFPMLLDQGREDVRRKGWGYRGWEPSILSRPMQGRMREAGVGTEGTAQQVNFPWFAKATERR